MDKIVLLIVFCYRYFCDCKKNGKLPILGYPLLDGRQSAPV